MSEENRKPDALIERILAEARAEAESLRDEANRTVEERGNALERRVDEIHETARTRIEEETERLRRRSDAAISLAEGRAALQREDRLYRTAEQKTREAMRALRDADEYVELLADWIVEAARGLGSDRAVVSCPEADRRLLDAAMEAAGKRLAADGSGVELTHDPTRTETGQGVVLRSPDGRRAFSNLVHDRMRRLGGELQRIYYHSLIEEQDGRADHR